MEAAAVIEWAGDLSALGIVGFRDDFGDHSRAVRFSRESWGKELATDHWPPTATDH